MRMRLGSRIINNWIAVQCFRVDFLCWTPNKMYTSVDDGGVTIVLLVFKLMLFFLIHLTQVILSDKNCVICWHYTVCYIAWCNIVLAPGWYSQHNEVQKSSEQVNSGHGFGQNQVGQSCLSVIPVWLWIWSYG